MDIKNAYEILGLNKNATTAEVQSAYMRKKAEYGELRFSMSDSSGDVVQKLEELEIAYQYILDEQNKAKYSKKKDEQNKEDVSAEVVVGEIVRPDDGAYKRANEEASYTSAGKQYGSSSSDTEKDADFESRFRRIEEYLKNGDVNTAQSMLDEMTYRPAEWHYLQSIIYYKKNWYLETKKQLELALNMDPDNKKYKNALDKLVKLMSDKQADPSQFTSGTRDNTGATSGYGGMPNNGTCTGSCCGDVCVANMCCNCAQGCCCR